MIQQRKFLLQSIFSSRRKLEEIQYQCYLYKQGIIFKNQRRQAIEEFRNLSDVVKDNWDTH